MCEEFLNFRGAQLSRMSFFMEEDESTDPIEVGLLGAIGVVLEAEGFGQLVKEFFWHGKIPFPYIIAGD